jgi:hypothetical protein
MVLLKLLVLAIESLSLRPLRTLFLVLTVAIGAGATMFLVAFHRGLDHAIKDNLLKGLPDKELTVRAAGVAESLISSQLTSVFTFGQSQKAPAGITSEHVALFRRLHELGVTRQPLDVATRPMLPFMVQIQPDFERLQGVLSLLSIAISERDRRNAGGPVMFHGIDGHRAESELPVEIALEADEVPIFLAREWLGGASNFSQLQERPGGRRDEMLMRLAKIADVLFFAKGARGVPVVLLLSQDGERRVIQGRVVGFVSEATIHGCSVDAAVIEQWNAWNNSSRALAQPPQEPLQLAYNSVVLRARTTDDMLSAAAELARHSELDVSGRLVTARRLTNLRDLLPPATAVIGLILFFLAAGGIVVGLSLSVAEQTQRIGILRAVGARRLDILFLFLCEALIVGLLGVALGYGMQMLAISEVDVVIRQTIPGIDDVQTLFEPKPALNAAICTVGVLVALLAGLVPAFTATLIRPSEVLKA